MAYLKAWAAHKAYLKGTERTHGIPKARTAHTACLTGTEGTHVQFPYSSLSTVSQDRIDGKT